MIQFRDEFLSEEDRHTYSHGVFLKITRQDLKEMR